MIEQAQYTEAGAIRALIDGTEWIVPDDIENRHRQTIAEWEAAGNTITPYVAPPTAPVTVVSSRQFKLQLLASGLLDDVDAWIATQDQAIQIAYEYSGTFVRTEPMMQAGFAALGFIDEQIDAFFTAAAQL